MAVLWILEVWDGREGTFDAIDNSSATRKWRARTTSPYDDAFVVGAYGTGSGILPARFSPHPINPFFTRRQLRITNSSDSPYLWEIEADYSSEPLGEEEKAKEVEENPLNRPAKVRWRTNHYTVPIFKDLDGKAVVNSAGDYYDPPPEVDASYWVASVVKNVAQLPPWILTVDHPVNSEAFQFRGLTVEKQKARLSGLEISELQEENGFEFYAFAFSIEFKKRGWKLELLDQGLRQKDPSDATKRVRIKIADEDGNESDATAPVLLDGEGGVLTDPTPETAVFNEHRVYDELDFNLLPLT